MNSIPWYRSSVFTTAMLAFFTQLAPMLDAVFIDELLSGKAGASARAVSLVLTAAIVAFRMASTKQPLTLTKANADQPTIGRERQGGYVRPLLVAWLLGGAVLATGVMQGCQSLGVAEPKSFDDRYAYSLAQVTAVRKAATDLLNTQQISVADAEFVLKTTNEARAYLDTARLVYEAGDSVKSQRGLELTTNVLLQLQNFLNSRTAR